MMVANSWAAYMIGPIGIDKETGQFIGTVWQTVNNPLWHPLNIHRFLGNVAFGGLICGGYAAIKYLGAQTPEERARYDWRGYVGNFFARYATDRMANRNSKSPEISGTPER
jgi:hypothetical protein